jgi:hypothetical protein
MTSRSRPPVPWRRRGAWIASVAVLVSVVAHLAAIWWGAGLLMRPQVIWVQAELPLVLDTVPTRAASAPRTARKIQPPRVPTPLARPTAPRPTDESASPATAPVATQAPAADHPTPGDMSAATEAGEPPAAAPAAPEPAPVAADTGPLWLPGQTSQLPGAPQTVHYKVLGAVNQLTYHASSSLSFEPQPGSAYTVSYRVGAFLLGNRTQISQGQIVASGLEPRRFTDQSRRTQITQVDVERQRVKLPSNPNEQTWTPGTQDRLSVFVQLGAWVAAMPTAFEKGQAFRVPVWRSRDTETWLVVSQGNENIPTPYGERQAIRLARMPLAPGDARVDVWFVPPWGAMPVRIEMVEANGNRAEQTLSEIDPAPPVQSP